MKTPTNDLPPETAGSEARQRGRQLTLTFDGDELPVLARIEFKLREGLPAGFLEKGHPVRGSGFEWEAVAQALSLLFLKYLIWDKSGRPDTFYFSGKSRDSLAASLGDAFYKDNPFQELFSDPTAPPKRQRRMMSIFRGDNLAGKSPRKTHRHITVSEYFLPPDCVEIVWKQRGAKPLVQIQDFQRLEDRIRRAWNLPPEPTVPTGEGSASAEPSSPPSEPPKATPPPPFSGKRSKSALFSATELESEAKAQAAKESRTDSR